MKGGRSYDIFPRTAGSRVLLAAAFLGGLATMVAIPLLFVLLIISLPFEQPCKGDDLASCLEEQTELQAMAREFCDGSGRRVCLAPLGNVSPELVDHLVSHYREQYGLEVTVLTPRSVPIETVDDEREQIDAAALIGYMGKQFPNAYADPDVVLIGLTPADIYDRESHYRFLFGLKGAYADPKAVVSTYRMDLRSYTFGLIGDEDLLFSRTRKLVSKYIGLLYYDLPPSAEPGSPMYDSILSTRDLDDMQEPLPVATPP